MTSHLKCETGFLYNPIYFIRKEMYIFQKTRNLLKKHPIEAELGIIQPQLDVFQATLAKIDMNFEKVLAP
jgi:hypothetical protein